MAEVWWVIGGVCLLVAMFQAWKDEHDAKRRLEEEHVGPSVTLQWVRHQITRLPSWMLINSGADAFNIDSDQMSNGNRFALLDRVPMLGRGQSASVTFTTYRNTGEVLLPSDPHLNHIFRAVLDDKSLPDAQFSAQMRIPVVLRYIDARGLPFETRCTIEWDLAPGNSGDGRVVHGTVRRLVSDDMSFYKRLKRKILYGE